MNMISGYFDNTDILVKQMYGYNYFLFMKYWLRNKFPKYDEDYDVVVFYFQQDELTKIHFIVDQKVTYEITGDEWLHGVVDLDVRESEKLDAFRDEYLSNMAKFMKYIRFANPVIPTNGSDFILPIYAQSGKA